ncbi:MAG: hypothetical protein J5U19_06815 [Candidatus Methanoperedens sp.]|nr:hypothetical protein [Candidatus Methanoperedens sp.]
MAEKEDWEVNMNPNTPSFSDRSVPAPNYEYKSVIISLIWGHCTQRVNSSSMLLFCKEVCFTIRTNSTDSSYHISST